MCNTDFSINRNGLFDLKQPAQYKGHQQKEKGTNIIACYFINVKTPVYDSITACELGLVYNSVKQRHCYSSLDCLDKLVQSLFHGSDVAGKLACGRKKSE